MIRFTLAVSILLAASTPLLAHHSFAAEYDRNKPFTVRGTVTKVEWMNPHAYFYLDVKDETGKVTNWAFELGNLSTLMRGGWRKTTMKIGDVVTVDAFRAKDGTHLGNGRSVVMADGTKIFAGSSAGEYAGN
jgi:DNA/RNA endonuclease YhcR with UshA esterase domain